MSSLEAQRTLGLKHVTVLRLAQAGLIRHVKGPECNFPIGYHFLRDDVLKIKHAFEKHVVPGQEYSKAGKLITLRHAVKNYFFRDSGLPAAIRAVIDGTLVPVGYSTRFHGSLVTFSGRKICANTALCQMSRRLPKASSTSERPHRCWASEAMLFAAWQHKAFLPLLPVIGMGSQSWYPRKKSTTSRNDTWQRPSSPSASISTAGRSLVI
jgi:hypothetical protein